MRVERRPKPSPDELLGIAMTADGKRRVVVKRNRRGPLTLTLDVQGVGPLVFNRGDADEIGRMLVHGAREETR